jgi:effector-binding domain-containing protein
MNYQVELTHVREQLIAAARQRTTFKNVSQEIRQLLDAPWSFIRAHRDLRAGGHNVAIYWNPIGPGSIEVGVQIVKPFDDTETVVLSATPGGRAATTPHFGEYSKLGPAHDAVRNWCRENNHQLAGPFWEVYGDWHDDLEKVRTDVFYLLAEP